MMEKIYMVLGSLALAGFAAAQHYGYTMGGQNSQQNASKSYGSGSSYGRIYHK